MPIDERANYLLTCTLCGYALDKYEAENPYTVPDKEAILCDECYHAHYEFRCALCDGWGNTADQHWYVAVFDASAVGLPLSGLYLITDSPYYAKPTIIASWIDTYAGTWLGALPAKISSNRPPSEQSPWGHLCAPCQHRALAHILYLTRCGVAVL